ncbi:hypothetical protein SAMN05192533_109196 [Mesobacillus persicus]|uniref:Uncharacterized protein n=1 Tax=Mesobacillus persicus TaxID=930146 RepID=A0A1H8E9T9_9BACI|nr:hypothetical protein [Mesobacillus persicus]SEN15607.1 hypothetical protein SAMN05192533_109196 [Mesobacillus persicus]
MSEDSQDITVAVPTVFINGKEYPLSGDYQLSEEDMEKVMDAINDSIAESVMKNLKELQKGLPLIGQFLQNRRFLPKVEGNLRGNVKLTFNDRTLFKLELPEPKNSEDHDSE